MRNIIYSYPPTSFVKKEVLSMETFRRIVKALKQLPAGIIKTLKAHRAENIGISEECKDTNIKRIYFSTLAAIPVHILIILQFIFTKTHGMASRVMWRRGIILAHSALLIFMALVFLITSKIKRCCKPPALAPALTYTFSAFVLLAGAVIVAIDQLVLTSITPFLIVCIITGTLYYIRPPYSLALYLFAYCAFCFLIKTTVTLTDVLLLNHRANGLTAAGLGFLLSLLFWRANSINIKQRSHIKAQQAELEKANKALEHMAFSDSLTGLPNRRFFDEALKREAAAIARKGHDSSLIILDLDYFKQINDTYGHYVGDAVLKQVSELFKKALRSTDLLCRLGGEEFILLLPETNMRGALTAAEKLRKLLENHVFQAEGVSIRITASLGVMGFTPMSLNTPNYFAPADKALYIAKQNGRNRVEAAL